MMSCVAPRDSGETRENRRSINGEPYGRRASGAYRTSRPFAQRPDVFRDPVREGPRLFEGRIVGGILEPDESLARRGDLVEEAAGHRGFGLLVIAAGQQEDRDGVGARPVVDHEV